MQHLLVAAEFQGTAAASPFNAFNASPAAAFDFELAARLCYLIRTLGEDVRSGETE
jgi:hypothetical protein